MPFWPWTISRKKRIQAGDAATAKSTATGSSTWASGEARTATPSSVSATGAAAMPIIALSPATAVPIPTAQAMANERLQHSSLEIPTVCGTSVCYHPTGLCTMRKDWQAGPGSLFASSTNSVSLSAARPRHACDSTLQPPNGECGYSWSSCSSNGRTDISSAARPLAISSGGAAPAAADGSAAARWWPPVAERSGRRGCQLQPTAAGSRRTGTSGGPALVDNQETSPTFTQKNHLQLGLRAADCTHRLQCFCSGYCVQLVPSAGCRSGEQWECSRCQPVCTVDTCSAYAFCAEQRLTAYRAQNLPQPRSYPARVSSASALTVESTKAFAVWQPRDRLHSSHIHHLTTSAATGFPTASWQATAAAAGLATWEHGPINCTSSSFSYCCCMPRTPPHGSHLSLIIGEHTSARVTDLEHHRSADSAATAKEAGSSSYCWHQLSQAWPSLATGSRCLSEDICLTHRPNDKELDCPGDAAVWHRRDCGCSSSAAVPSVTISDIQPSRLQYFHSDTVLLDGPNNTVTNGCHGCSDSSSGHASAGPHVSKSSSSNCSGRSSSSSSSQTGPVTGVGILFAENISKVEYYSTRKCDACGIRNAQAFAAAEAAAALVDNSNGESRDSITWSTGSHEDGDGCQAVWQLRQQPDSSSVCHARKVSVFNGSNPRPSNCSFGRASLPSLPSTSGTLPAAGDVGAGQSAPSASTAECAFTMTEAASKEFRKVSAPAAIVTTTLLDALHAKHCSTAPPACLPAPACTPDVAASGWTAGPYSASPRNETKGRTYGTVKRSAPGGVGNSLSLASRVHGKSQGWLDQATQRKSSNSRIKMFGDVSKLFSQPGRTPHRGSTTGRSRSLGENNCSNLDERHGSNRMVTTRAESDASMVTPMAHTDPAVTGGACASHLPQPLPQTHVQQRRQLLLKVLPAIRIDDDPRCKRANDTTPPATSDALATAAAERRANTVVRKFSLSPRFPRRLAVQQQPEPLRHHGEDVATRASRQRGGSKLSLGYFKWGKLTTDQLDALEACSWLMEAGFPQYVQMFEEHRLLVDVVEVASDHRQISENLLKPLYRRLQTLAKLSKLNVDLSAAGIKLDCASAGHSDSGVGAAGGRGAGALSFNWRLDRKSRKWSRKPRCATAAQSVALSSAATAPPTAANASAAAYSRDTALAAAAASTSSSATPTGSSSSDSCDSALGGSSSNSSSSSSAAAAEPSHRSAAIAAARLQYGHHHGPTAQTMTTENPTSGDATAASSASTYAAALSRSSDSVVSPADLSCSSPDASLEEEEEEENEESCSSPSSSSSSSSSPSSASSSPALSAGRNRQAGSSSTTWTGTGRRRHRIAASHSRRKPGATTSVMAQPAVVAASTERQLVIGEPVLIRSAETDERLRRLGCLDLASAAAAERGTLSSACFSCGAPPRVETMYLLPAGHVFGTFPASLVSQPVRRACGRCGAPPLPPKAKDTSPTGTLASPKLFLGHTSAGAAAATKIRPGGRDVPVLDGTAATASAFAAPNLARSPSIYDNLPLLGSSGSEPAVPSSSTAAATSTGSAPSLGSEVHPLADLYIQRQGAVASSSATATLAASAAGRAMPSQQLLVPPSAAGAGQTSPEDRRDSGVGLSLQREPASSKADTRKRTTRGQLWRGFAPSTGFASSSCGKSLEVWQLSAAQLSCLRKLCMLKITAQLEEHCPRDVANGILSGLQHLKMSQKSVVLPEQFEGDGDVVFGVPLCVIQRTEGYPLPACIREVMATLCTVAKETVGVFRRPGVRSRIQKLRNEMDARKDVTSVDGVQAYDLADVLKQFFRELPEPLFTDKLSEVFLAIHQYVPPPERMDAMRAALVLMPCENREALRDLIEFLALVAGHASTNQMTSSNLAVCFAPSLFSLASFSAVAGGHAALAASSRSPKVPRKNSGPPADHIGDLLDQKYAHECLKQMLDNSHRLFQVPEDFAAYNLVGRDEMQPSQLPALLRNSGGSYRVHVDECIRGLLKEFCRKPKGWLVDRLPAYMGIESLTVSVGHKETAPRDGCLPLPLWRASIDIEAPPVEVLTRLVYERALWDDNASSAAEARCCRRQLDGETELVHFSCRHTTASAAAATAGSLLLASDGGSEQDPSTVRRTVDHVMLRSWRTQLEQYPGTCVLISHSVDPAACAAAVAATASAADRRPQPLDEEGHCAGGRLPTPLAITYASHYIVEPCGAGRSRVTHLACVDLLGRMPAWYERNYACLLARALARLRESFRRQHACMTEAGVPETSV